MNLEKSETETETQPTDKDKAEIKGIREKVAESANDFGKAVQKYFEVIQKPKA